MACVDNFVPKVSVFSILGKCPSLVMSYPIFSPSNPLVRPKTHPYLSKCLTKHVFFEFPTLKVGGASLTSPSTGGWAGGGGGSGCVFMPHGMIIDMHHGTFPTVDPILTGVVTGPPAAVPP